MNLIVAVSGGVDSVVLLHKLVQNKQHNQLIVAHFDHGIRIDSSADERFVHALAESYGLPYVSKREELGPSASEATARERRYEFLHKLVNEHNAKLVTAHHQDDLIETMAINFSRGTGWRGLAVLGDDRILRPLLHYKKAELYQYALTHALEWAEDETNRSSVYLRNRLRVVLASLEGAARARLIELWQQQKALRRLIDQETTHLAPPSSRYWFNMIPNFVAIELLRAVVDGQLTRPQLEVFLHKIKTAKAGSEFQAGGGIVIRFSLREFIVQNTSKLL